MNASRRHSQAHVCVNTRGGEGMRRAIALLPAALIVAALALALGGKQAPAAPAPVTAAAAATHTVTYDKYSLMVDGKRVFVWAGEFHYFRQPSPGLWRD